MMISPAIFFIFQNFDFGDFQGGKSGKKDLRLPISVCLALYLRNCRSYNQDFDNIQRCLSLFFLKKCNIVNTVLKLFCFLLAHFNSFFNSYLFFKFINKCQKEILRCASPSSHVYDFLSFFFIFTSFNTTPLILLGKVILI